MLIYNMNFTRRQRKLILLLLSKDEKSLDKNKLAMKFFVSTRTIIKEINDINLILKEKLHIYIKRNQGYIVQIIDKDFNIDKFIEEIKNELHQANDLNESKIRVKYIIRLLIDKNSYLTIQDIADYLFVSKQTVSSDLKKVKLVLKNYHLDLISKANQGLIIVGLERDKRRCYSYCLPYEFDAEQAYVITSYEKAFFLNVDIERIYQVVCDELASYPFDLVDGAEKMITYHIAISILRNDTEIFENEPNQEIIENHFVEYDYVSKILDSVTSFVDFSFSYNEKIHILFYLIGCTKRKTLDANSSGIIKMDKFLKDNYNIDLSKFSEIRTSLNAHLLAYENRMKYHIIIKNPLLKEIKDNYLFYYDIAFLALNELYKNVTVVTEDEAAFLALYLIQLKEFKWDKVYKAIIVCPAGITSGKIIENNIVNIFRGLVVVEKVINHSEYLKTDKFDCDFIVSSLTLEKKGCKIIKIKGISDTFLLEQEVKKYIAFDNKDHSLNQLFFEDLFYYDLDIKKDELFLKISDDMAKKGYVNNDFYESIMERESISSTCILNYIAMPHPMKNCSLKTGIAVVITKNDLVFDDDIVKILFFINAKEKDFDLLNLFYQRIVEISNDKNQLEILLKCRSVSEYINVLKSNY